MDNVTVYQSGPGQLSLGGQLLLHVPPTEDSHAINKGYVDALAAMVQQQAQMVANLTARLEAQHELLEEQAQLIANLTSRPGGFTQKRMFKAIGGNGTWTVPDGVAQVRVMLSGGGGGGGSGDEVSSGAGSMGGDTTFGPSLIAAGGQAGQDAGTQANACTIGSDLTGAPGGPAGTSWNGSPREFTGQTGCPGKLVLQLLTVTPGEILKYFIGEGGAGSQSTTVSNGAKGGDGYLVLEWEE